jgi:hypothetical protein
VHSWEGKEVRPGLVFTETVEGKLSDMSKVPSKAERNTPPGGFQAVAPGAADQDKAAIAAARGRKMAAMAEAAASSAARSGSVTLHPVIDTLQKALKSGEDAKLEVAYKALMDANEPPNVEQIRLFKEVLGKQHTNLLTHAMVIKILDYLSFEEDMHK